jgi:hypothetical protein
MIKPLLAAVIVASVVASSALTAPPATHLFILSGQSNMAGLNPALTFTPAVNDAFGSNSVIVVKDALGGQPIRRWYKDWKPAAGTAAAAAAEANGDLYDRLMQKVQPAIAGRQIDTVTFVWMQGESDAKMKQGAVYAASLRGLLAQLSDDLGRKDVNFVIGRISDFGTGRAEWNDWSVVRAAEEEVGGSGPRCAWVDTDDLNDKPDKNGTMKDDLHYSAEGYRTLGTRFAEKSIALIRQNASRAAAPPRDR